MKIQEVKKECAAIVGLSIEFSNSEIDSIVRLIWDLELSIEKGYGDLHSMIDCANAAASGFERRDAGVINNINIDSDNATITVDLKTLVRCQWLLNMITKDRAKKPSSLFDQIDDELAKRIESFKTDLT